jgi:DNA-directed RNA polymerase subunit RPC12/RpoP
VALIQCPDCGREVSDQAPACVGCGRPLAARRDLSEQRGVALSQPSNPQSSPSTATVSSGAQCPNCSEYWVEVEPLNLAHSPGVDKLFTVLGLLLIVFAIAIPFAIPNTIFAAPLAAGFGLFTIYLGKHQGSAIVTNTAPRSYHCLRCNHTWRK